MEFDLLLQDSTSASISEDLNKLQVMQTAAAAVTESHHCITRDFHTLTFSLPVTVSVSGKVSPGDAEQRRRRAAFTRLTFPTFFFFTIRPNPNTPNNLPPGARRASVLDSFMIIDLRSAAPNAGMRWLLKYQWKTGACAGEHHLLDVN